MTGISLMLVSTWMKVSSITSSKPLLALFPGRCTTTLRKLGVDGTKCTEHDLLLIEPEPKNIVKRAITALSISGHKFDYAKELAAVDWSPTASMEVLIELDGR